MPQFLVVATAPPTSQDDLYDEIENISETTTDPSVVELITLSDDSDHESDTDDDRMEDSPESPDYEGISDEEFRARWGVNSIPQIALQPPFFDWY